MALDVGIQREIDKLSKLIQDSGANGTLGTLTPEEANNIAGGFNRPQTFGGIPAPMSVPTVTYTNGGTQPASTGTGEGIWNFLKNLIGNNSSLFTGAAMGGAGALMDANNAKNMISPTTALGGGTVDGTKIYGQQNRYNDMQNMLTQATGNATTNPTANPMLTQARQGFQNRVNTPVAQPKPYTPYGGTQNQSPDWGAMLAQLLPQLKGAGQPNTSPVQTSGNAYLQQAMRNRFTPRPMGG